LYGPLGIGQSLRAQHAEKIPSGTRDLTIVECRLLDAMLDVDGLEHAESLRLQAATARASSSCACGCGSIYLVVGEGVPTVDVSLPVVEGDVLSDQSEVIGGLLLFACDGRLHDLEVYSFADAPLPLPSPERARVRRYQGGSTP
jgi:hypothetical protein